MSNKWPWDHVYVLNLDKDKKKWIKMKKQLKKLNIKAERFSAVYGLEKFPFGDEIKNAKTKYDKWILIEKMNEKLKNEGIVSKEIGYKYPYIRPGELGHLASFLKIFQDALKKNYQKILVLEDDAVFVNDFRDKFFKSYNELPNDWSLLYLGHHPSHLNWTCGKKIKHISKNVCKIPGVEDKGGKKSYRKGGIAGTHAMVLKRRAIKEWLVKAYPFKIPSDHLMGQLDTIYKRIKSYYTCENIVYATSTSQNSTTREC